MGRDASSLVSQSIGSSVYLKLEVCPKSQPNYNRKGGLHNLQPSHSFKYRGISHVIQHKYAELELGDKTHVVIASSGNAGLAAAWVAREYGLRCTVFIPLGISASTLAILKREKAEVVVYGKFYAEAYKAAERLVEKDPNALMVHSYNDPLLWEGHSSIIKEIRNQIPKKPDTILCSVGGGLLGGVLHGCKAVGWDDVPIITVETTGSDSFYHSVSLNNGRFNSTARTLPDGVNFVHDPVHDVHMAHFQRFNSKASSSLGASQSVEAILRMALDWKGGVKSISVPDEISMESLALFADNQKMLVELACSTTLVPAYHRALFDRLVPPLKSGEERVAVFIVCGGFKISVAEATEFQRLLKESPWNSRETWAIHDNDGSLVVFPK